MSEKQNICVITCWFPNGELKQGTFVQDTSAALAHHTENNVAVYHLLVNHGPKWLQISKEETWDEKRNLKVYTFHVSGKLYKWVYAAPPLLAWMAKNDFRKRVLNQFKPTLLHAHVVHPAGIVTAIIAKKNNLPFIITEHWSKLDRYFSRSLFAALGKRTYRQAKAVVCVSEFLKKNILKHAPFAEPIVIPNVVEEVYKPLPTQAPQDAIHLLCIAHWKTPKRLDLILAAAEKAAQEFNKKVTLYVVGDGPDLQKIKTEFTFDIIKLGFLSKEEIFEHMQHCHALLHASNTETFSLVVAEALASGLPVLASNVGAIPDLVSEKEGILVENTPEQWQRGIVQLLHTTWSREEIASSADRFHPKAIAHRYQQLLEKL